VQADDKPSAIVVGVGAEQGLGAALCRRFAAQRYHVFAAGRTSAKINKVVRASSEYRRAGLAAAAAG
jgi:NAD(P)-dependent dehydrogenase (short-subunit alcohol dehydrogenase family)